MTELVASLEAVVRERMARFDCSHDYAHVERVRRLAKELAAAEHADLLVTDLAALLHDVNDHKYDGGGVDLRALLRRGDALTAAQIDAILHVVDNVSYSKQVAQADSAAPVLTKELMCVRDADRLDAIGAVGIARCAAFSAARNRPLYDAFTREGPLARGGPRESRDNSSMIGHFHCKLLGLPGLLHTERARQLAAKRVEIMRAFVACLEEEVDPCQL